jgi:two-component system, chemotaxis family, CheB/CheR fusion protein
MTDRLAEIPDLKALIAQLPVALCVCEAPSGLIRLYNRRAAELWGRQPASGQERFCGASRLFLTNGTYLPHAQTPMAEVLLSGGERNEDLVIERPDGSRVTIRVNVAALRDAHGHIVGALNAFHDVSERRLTDADAARLASIVVSAEDAIIGKSLDGHITSWNRAAELMFGYTAAEALEKPITMIIPPERLQEEKIIIDRLSRGESIMHFETERLTKDERRIPISLTVSPIRDRHGCIIGASKVARDISDRKRLEHEREELLARERVARAEAEAASQTKDEFLAMLAHELRNPVGAIVNALAVVDATTEQAPQHGRARAVIRRQTQQLARLLDDLLDMARITSGRIELEREHIDMRPIVQEALETERQRIEQKRQHVTLALGTHPVMVVADPSRLRQMIGNLVNNASKYTPLDGSISITLAAEGDNAVLRVLDNGVGIPPTRLETIFDLFEQVNPSLARTEGGLGIGLTLVRRLAKLHGGEVHARSDGPVRGAEFIVRLPLAHETMQPPVGLAPAAPLAPRRILVIEDNRDGREMLATVLRLSGHEVFAAATGKDDIEMAQWHPPAVVMVDIGLPDIDGYEVARRLRETIGDTVRLIALTGYGQARDRARSQQAGFNAHVIKPVDPSKLAEVIRQPR